MPVVGGKAPPKGGKAPAAKDAKGKGAAVLEEITDNRPREIQFVKNFGEEVGTIKIYESLAKYLENFQMGISVYSIDRETQEEKKLESLSLDIS